MYNVSALRESRIRAHHQIANALWDGIVEAKKGWVICREATISNLWSLKPPEGVRNEWMRFLDELDEGVQMADTGGDEDDRNGGTEESLAERDLDSDNNDARPFHRQRPDAISVHWRKKALFLLEFTRPYDGREDFYITTDDHKVSKYRGLRDEIRRNLPGWEVDVLPFTMGTRGSFHVDTWKSNLSRLDLPERRFDDLMSKLVLETLIQMNEIYKVRQGALNQKQGRSFA